MYKYSKTRFGNFGCNDRGEIDGFEICKKIREKGLNFPIIMLTAKIEDKDKITGLTFRPRPIQNHLTHSNQ